MTEKKEARVLDAAALKALAHPLRVEIVDQLTLHGAATASQLAHRLDQNSGATSYHLRQLARHGLVREVEGAGTARERWWEVVPGGMQIHVPDDADPATLESAKMIARQWAQQRFMQVDAFIRKGDTDLGEEWTEGSLLASSRVDLTPDELAEMSKALHDAMIEIRSRYLDRGKRPGTRTVQIQVNNFPLVDAPQEES